MTDVDVAIVGAGPHGLAATAHLRRAGVDVAVVGDPMSSWRRMPKGMLLRSNWTASCIAEYEGPLSLDAYVAATGRRFGTPVPLERFLEYGDWVQQQVAPDVAGRVVERLDDDGDRFALHFADGDSLRARRVVVAAGIGPFAHRPRVAAGLPREMASHVSDHSDLSLLSGRRVLVVGGGQSALESAALLHEAGADVEVVVRKPQVLWNHGGRYHRLLGPCATLVYAPSDVGPMGLSRLVSAPDLLRRLPRKVQDPAAYRSIRPAVTAWLRPRLEGVPIRVETAVRDLRADGESVRVGFSDGTTRTVDHVLFATGYQVDVAKYSFLDPALTERIEQVRGYPVLRSGMESSVSRLHFVGAPAAWSFGPTMRFVAGGWYAGRSVARSAVRGDRRRRRGAAVSRVSTGEAT